MGFRDSSALRNQSFLPLGNFMQTATDYHGRGREASRQNFFDEDSEFVDREKLEEGEKGEILFGPKSAARRGAAEATGRVMSGVSAPLGTSEWLQRRSGRAKLPEVVAVRKCFLLSYERVTWNSKRGSGAIRKGHAGGGPA